MPVDIGEDCKLPDMFHKAPELLPILWTKAGYLDEAITAYCWALIKPWNIEPDRFTAIQKSLARTLLYGGVEANLPPQLQIWGTTMPKNNTEEAILLLVILVKKVALRETKWDPKIMNHLTYALSVTGLYRRAERWYFLALCYTACGKIELALKLLKKLQAVPKQRPSPTSLLFSWEQNSVTKIRFTLVTG
nr:protein NPGR1-like [Malus domestica]